MTSYSSMAARGREAARDTTTGRRKVIAERIEWEPAGQENTMLDRLPYPPRNRATARLIGSCGHTLRWLASVPLTDTGPALPHYLTSKVGRRMTCQHDDCRIPPKETRP